MEVKVQMKGFIGSIVDPYERKARVTPALLVLLPILVPFAANYGSKLPSIASVLGLLGACGAVYALANISRGRGKKLEEKLLETWGGMPTTIALRHRGTHLDSVSKARYHAEICTKLGMRLPTEAEEKHDPARADDYYIAATKRMRELTRDEQSLLLKENIAYGFHRNMLAMKPIGIVISLSGVVYGLHLADAIQREAPYIQLQHMLSSGTVASLTTFVSLILLYAWLFYFTPSAVRLIGFEYAERLFEAMTKLQTHAKRNNDGSDP